MSLWPPKRADCRMKYPPSYIFAAVVGAIAYFAVLWFLDRRVFDERSRIPFRYVAVATTILAFFLTVSQFIDDQSRAVDYSKAMIAMVAAGCVFYEAHRVGLRRPISERWKKFVGVTLGLAAICAYFNGFRLAWGPYYHRWDQYHYYMGAKYFREMGYDGLYKCSLIAQDELGVVTWEDAGRTMRLDMTKEVRRPDKTIRNLGGDNLIKPAAEFLAHREECKKGFSPARWDEYKEDVKFFRITSDKTYWEDMQRDHGFNPPPVWTVAGYAFSSMYAAGHKFMLPVIGSVVWLQLLAMLDIAYLLGSFAALWWGFGWRVFAVGAIFWGCQSSAPTYWTSGAFLRQDWFFWLVLSVCLLRKKYPVLAGAAVTYAMLLRVFPGLVLIGPVVLAGWHIAKRKRIAPEHAKMLLGGVLAAAVLIPVSLKVCGKDAYQQFYHHTIVVHDRTPLTNHMGLRVLISHNVGSGPSSGRMKYVKDPKLTDPFEVWKNMRNERYDKYRWVAYGLIALCFGFFVYVSRRIKSLWVSQCLAQIWIIMLSQLTCYYYSFMILSAPLTKVMRSIEIPLFGLAALTQFTWMAFYWYDDRYTALTAISLIFCVGLVCVFAPKGFLRGAFGRSGEDEAEEAST